MAHVDAQRARLIGVPSLGALAGMLEAIDRLGGAVEAVPPAAGIPSSERMETIEELLRQGWIEAAASLRGDGHLFAVRNIRITANGRDALVRLRRETARAEPTEARLTPLEEKRSKRFQFMMRLYEETDGSRLAHVDMWQLGKALGWDRSETDKTVEYLEGEGLLEYAAMGGALAITHRGVVEVEEALSAPDRSTEHFPPAANVINVHYMVGSQIVQGSPGAEQHGQFSFSTADVADVVAQVRAALPDLVFADNTDRLEFEQELATVENQLGSPRPKASTLQTSLSTLATLITKASVTAGSAVQLLELAKKIHDAVPGI